MRERLPNRRPHIASHFEYDSQRYHYGTSRFPNGKPAEIFLTTNKAGSAAQQHAECAAILCSLCLQHGVAAETIIHAVKGSAIAVALELAVQS
jgi:hypothetical protein